MTLDTAAREILSGRRRGPAATALRALTAFAEPLYRFVVSRRNRSFDRNPRRSRSLPRPVVSVGNLTTGGTGKTPIVRWLAEELRGRGLCVAILSRGYKARPGEWGDEQRMLDALLNPPGSVLPRVLIRSHPNRYEAGLLLLRSNPEIDVFILDDGFQHRRLARDLDLVLINANEPFGFGHLLPRGLLREPVESLSRANAVVITHADAVSAPQCNAIVHRIQRVIANLPVHRCIHAPAGLSGSDLKDFAGVRVMAASAIGYPEGFERELERMGMVVADRRRFADHHDYTAADLASLSATARQCGAAAIITTEKDWVKISPLMKSDGPLAMPIWRLDVRARFVDGSETPLLDAVLRTIAKSSRGR